MFELSPAQEVGLQVLLERPQNVFLTGFAGTGKTAVLRKAISIWKQHGASIRVCSPTGLAARQLNGTTLSKLLGLRLAKCLGEIEQVDLRQARENLEGVSLVVIDEVSLMSGDLLMLVDAVMREATGQDEPFGGIRMIFAGDFCQLPPVHDYGSPDPEYPLAFECPFFSDCLVVFLRENQRQTEEEDFDRLNEFRQGLITAAGKKCLAAMEKRSFPDALHLFPKKADAETRNLKKLNEMVGQRYYYPTEYFGCTAEEAAPYLPVGERVLVKVGAPVIILANDPEGSYVNGSQGQITAVYRKAARVRLTDGKQVLVYRKKWTLRRLTGEQVGEAEGMPLQLGWAATIHRAQGMTLDKVVVDLDSCWEPGQAYVALSRTRSLNDIAITSPVRAIKVDPVAVTYVNSLL